MAGKRPYATLSSLVLALTVCTSWAAAIPRQTPGPGGQAAGGQAAQAEEDERRKKVMELMRKVNATEDPVKQQKLLKEVLDIDPTNALAIDMLAKASQKIEAGEKARTEEREKAERQQKELEAGRQAYVQALATGSRSGLKGALAHVEEALKINPQSADAARLKRDIEASLLTNMIRMGLLLGLVAAVVVGAAVVAVLARRRPASLVVEGGLQDGQSWPLEKKLTVLGTLEPEADCVFQDSSNKVSRHHCDILRARGRYFLVDRSTNGTSVNGRRVPRDEPVLLRRRDVITLSEQIFVRFK
jgi:FHA domain